MATITVRCDPTRQFTTEIGARTHTWIADEPAPIGDDLGPSPYELLLSGLGACTVMTLEMYARRKAWPLNEVRITLAFDRVHADDARQCDDPARCIERIQRGIELIGPLDDTQRRRLLEIAAKCPVHKTLARGMQIEDRLVENTEPMM